MKFEEAIKALGEPVPIGDKNLLFMIRRGLYIFKTKTGLMQCTHDWPISFYPNKEDIMAEDWEIESAFKSNTY